MKNPGVVDGKKGKTVMEIDGKYEGLVTSRATVVDIHSGISWLLSPRTWAASMARGGLVVSCYNIHGLPPVIKDTAWPLWPKGGYWLHRLPPVAKDMACHPWPKGSWWLHERPLVAVCAATQ